MSIFKKVGFTIALMTLAAASVTSTVFYMCARDLIVNAALGREQSDRLTYMADLELSLNSISAEAAMLAYTVTTGDRRGESVLLIENLRASVSGANEALKELDKVSFGSDDRSRNASISGQVSKIGGLVDVFLSDSASMAENPAPLFALRSEIDRLTEEVRVAMREAQESSRRASSASAASSSLIFVLFLSQNALGLVIAVAMFVVMTRWLPHMMKEPFEKVSQSIALMNSGAEQLRQMNDALAEQAVSQSASLEQIMVAINTMRSVNAQKSENLMQVAAQKQAAFKTMDELWKMSKTLVQQMEALEQSGQSISRFTKTIDEVAFQTNILSLNASVEAARAGSAGLGFAVVADEVRSLASKTSQSSKEIGQHIRVALDNITQSKNMQTLSDRSVEALRSANGMMESVFSESETLIQQHEKEVNELTSALTGFDRNSQQLAASSEETAGMVSALVQQADETELALMQLKELTGLR